MKLSKYLLLIALLFAILSCSREAGEDPNALVGLEPRIAGVSLITRGGASSANDIETLGIYAVNKTSGESLYGTSPAGTYRKYKLTNGVAAPNAADQTLWLNMEKAIIFSYHPIVSSVSVTPGGNATAPVPTITVQAAAITLAQTITVSQTDNSYNFALPANDYMYGVKYDDSKSPEAAKFLSEQPIADNGHQKAGGISPDGPQVKIGLKHAFAQVSFIIKRDDTYKGEAKVTKLTHTRKMPTLNAGNSTIMNLTDGALTNLEAAAEKTYSYTFSGFTPALSQTTSQITLTNYVIPYNDTSNPSSLKITVDGKEMALASYTDPAWAAGNIYTYTILIKPTGLTLKGFNITGWDDTSIPNVNV